MLRTGRYVVESHDVPTSDGYILSLKRIPYARNLTTLDDQRPVVFLMHGFGGHWMNYLGPLAPELSIGYNLVDAGFDVWFGNARGNIYSRRHASLDPDDPQQKLNFWDFSWEEVGLYDLPAMIDYALKYTDNSKLHYIGGSQGGTEFLVMASLKPEYNEKMASVHLLAGVGYQKHFPDKQMAAVASAADILYGFTRAIGLVEFKEQLLSSVTLTSGASLTYGGPIVAHNLTHIMENSSRDSANVFGGTSMKTLFHYFQNVRDRKFQRFDYGTDNVVRYGTATPPLYNLSDIRSNVTMHYGAADRVLDERDVLAMVKDMPNAVARKVARDSFEHSDFVLAEDAKDLVG
ncbi:hypothetical protein O0L34_g13555 [Tuta absoluta]|nr:hypothetical protein O0L34_g13555 [Tuta absoluta]